MADFDPRETPSNGRVAHVSLKGKVQAERFVEGEWHPVYVSVADILVSPKGPRTRQLTHGERFRVIDMQDGMVFGFAERDGYCGWVNAKDFIAAETATPRVYQVSAARTFGLSAPDVKATARSFPCSFGMRVAVLDWDGDWARVPNSRGTVPSDMYIPKAHLRPVDAPFPDPATIAELFLHTPYLWGGNTAFGIDCSGLVQAALLACGIACPGDSDQQEARVGTLIDPGEPYQRGDLIFWKGHVGMMCDAETLIHANAHHMAVATEPLGVATARIAATGGGPIMSRRRI